MTDESTRAFEIISALRAEFYADRKYKELCDELLDLWRICDGETRPTQGHSDNSVRGSGEELRHQPGNVRAESGSDDKSKLVRAARTALEAATTKRPKATRVRRKRRGS